MTHPNDTKVQQKRSERVSGLFKHEGSPDQPGYYSAYRASGTVKRTVNLAEIAAKKSYLAKY